MNTRPSGPAVTCRGVPGSTWTKRPTCSATDVSSTRIVPPPPLAGTIALLASRGAADAIEPAAVRPLYVRRPDVEIARDEQLRRGAARTSDN